MDQLVAVLSTHKVTDKGATSSTSSSSASAASSSTTLPDLSASRLLKRQLRPVIIRNKGGASTLKRIKVETLPKSNKLLDEEEAKKEGLPSIEASAADPTNMNISQIVIALRSMVRARSAPGLVFEDSARTKIAKLQKAGPYAARLAVSKNMMNLRGESVRDSTWDSYLS
ncbi:unnamed protein product, partial [Amoebophrya sp. A25]|eukprot:GSA25T00002870001.1